MEEKRKFVRLDVGVNVKWKKVPLFSMESSLNLDVTKDISRGGIRISSDEVLQKDDILQLEITLPTDKIIHATGRVAWSKEYGSFKGKRKSKYVAGIIFVKIPKQDKDELHKFMFNSINRG
ncbi:MAG: PilZ domain-containing protein [Candidatus Omnitrophota bacterium]